MTDKGENAKARKGEGRENGKAGIGSLCPFPFRAFAPSRFRVLFGFFHLGLCALLIAGCGRGDPDAAPGPRPVRVGYLPNLTHAVALLGLDEGRFQRALGPGARVEGTQFVAGTEIVTAIAAGEIDLAYMGPGPAIKAFTQGVKIRLLAGAASAGSVLLARPRLAVRSPQDLAGKRVTVPRYANTQDIILRGFLARAGLRDTAHGGTVEVLQSDSPELPVLFGHGQIDAAVVPEPWGARLAAGGARSGPGGDRGRARPPGNAPAIALTEAQMLGGEAMPSVVLVASTRFVERRPEWTRAWVATHRALVRVINAAPAAMSEQVNEALKRRTGKALKPAVMRQAWSRLTITDQVSDQQLNKFAAMMRSAGYLRVPFDPVAFRGAGGNVIRSENAKGMEGPNQSRPNRFLVSCRISRIRVFALSRSPRRSPFAFDSWRWVEVDGDPYPGAAESVWA